MLTAHVCKVECFPMTQKVWYSGTVLIRDIPFMSTLFPVFYTEKQWLLFNSPSTIGLFIWETILGKESLRIKVLTLVQNITENRLRHARGPVHLHRVGYIHIPTVQLLVLLPYSKECNLPQFKMFSCRKTITF